MDGAGWHKPTGTIVESEAKKLYTNMPVFFVTAITKQQKKNKSNDYGPFGGYECPCYKYPTRTDRYLIFMATLPSKDHRPLHWTLRGVALLCSTD